MKALGISGSPRRGGNTELAVQRVLASLAASGVETEFIPLAEYPVKPCIACYACAEGCGCAVSDPNFDLLLPKFAESDVLILPLTGTF